MSKANKETVDLWFDRIEEWKSSGLSRLAWCRNNDCSYYAFSYWYEKLVDLGRIDEAGSNKAEGTTKPTTKTSGEYTFVELDCSPTKAEDPPATSIAPEVIVQYKEFTVRIPEGSSRQNLSMIMEVLANA